MFTSAFLSLDAHIRNTVVMIIKNNKYQPADSGCLISLEGLLRGLAEHLVVLDGGEPVGEHVGEEVAAAHAIAFYERPSPEVLQAGTRRYQGLASSLGAGIGMLKLNIIITQAINISTSLCSLYPTGTLCLYWFLHLI